MASLLITAFGLVATLSVLSGFVALAWYFTPTELKHALARKRLGVEWHHVINAVDVGEYTHVQLGVKRRGVSVNVINQAHAYVYECLATRTTAAIDDVYLGEGFYVSRVSVSEKRPNESHIGIAVTVSRGAATYLIKPTHFGERRTFAVPR